MFAARKFVWPSNLQRSFSTTTSRLTVLDAAKLKDRIIPSYKGEQPSATSTDFHLLTSDTESRGRDLLSLQWPEPPQNILMVKKDGVAAVTESLLEYARYGQQL